jgi:hypothetical protein
MRRMRSIYSPRISNGREEFLRMQRRNPQALETNEFEARQLESLLGCGYAFAPGFFSKALADHIHKKADAILCHMPISRANISEVEDPLVQISEVLDVAFHESILKVVAHFFRHVPPVYRVAVVRYFPCNGMPHLNGFRQETNESDSLEMLIDLVAVDSTRGPIVYVPGSNLYGASGPRLLNAFGLPRDPRRLEDREVECVYPRETWVTLGGERGSVTAIHRRGLNKGPAWTFSEGANNKPRTAIRIESTGYKRGLRYEWRGNAMRKWNFERMTKFQQLFAHADLVEERMLA